MTELNTGGPAFPSYPNGQHNDGMTLRDYFAAKAMLALIQSNEYAEARGYTGWREELCRESYLYADAMLKARES